MASIMTASRSNIDVIQEFKRLAAQTVEYARQAQCPLIAFTDEGLPHFSQLADSEKRLILHRLKTFNEVCEEVLMAGKSLRDSVSMAWYGLKKLGLRFPSDLFTFMTDDHIIEFYDCSNIQVFRNFNFFHVTSFTLEDLLCRPWVDLFARENSEHTEQIVDFARRCGTKEITAVTPFAHHGRNMIIENGSQLNFKVDAVIDYLSPLWDEDGRPAGFVAVESAEIVAGLPISSSDVVAADSLL